MASVSSRPCTTPAMVAEVSAGREGAAVRWLLRSVCVLWWRCGGAAVRRCGVSAVRRCGGAAVQRRSVAVLGCWGALEGCDRGA